ncbi:MAG TPA: hypothetical protein VHV31_04125 [Nitrolancea sp.]|jgi:hypothetical protein|nr:hypothetical protein [Nitrolancea sp.]
MVHDSHDKEALHGFIMVDIGEDAGALVIYAPRELRGTEIEISPAGNDTSRQHVDILERKINERSVCAAVFPSLAPGDYSIWRPGGLESERVTVAPESVAEVDWR